jgi:hypothetical protein
MVLDAIDRIIGWLVERAQGLLRAVGIGRDDEADQGEEAGEYDGELGEVVRFTAQGESHRIWVRLQGSQVVPMMASTQRPIQDALDTYDQQAEEIKATDPEKAATVRQLVQTARTAVAEIIADGGRFVSLAQDPNAEDDQKAAVDDEVESAEANLKTAVGRILEELGIEVPEVIDPPLRVEFRRRPWHDEGEYRRQLLDQQEGINAMSVGRWWRNRLSYLARRTAPGSRSGRDPRSANEQRRFREQQWQQIYLEALAEGASEEDARYAADSLLSRTAALHDPDQIAGGEYYALGSLGDRRINSSIGAQWRYRIRDMEAAITRDRLHGIPETEWDSVDMRVELVLIGVRT